MQHVTTEEAIAILAEWAKAQMHREKTSRTYAKSFYQCIGHGESPMEKLTKELNEAPEGKKRALKQLIPQGEKGNIFAIIEEYEVL